jgi:hypothetical protein
VVFCAVPVGGGVRPDRPLGRESNSFELIDWAEKRALQIAKVNTADAELETKRDQNLPGLIEMAVRARRKDWRSLRMRA